MSHACRWMSDVRCQFVFAQLTMKRKYVNLKFYYIYLNIYNKVIFIVNVGGSAYRPFFNWHLTSDIVLATKEYMSCNDISIFWQRWMINGERWGVSGERVSESAIRLPHLGEFQWIIMFSRLSEDLFVILIWGRVSRCRRHSIMFSYRLPTNVMFSGLNPPDGEVQTIRGFSAQIPIFGCVKNFMHLISFYLSLIISISL